jgi:heterodisulfide reductase subunit C
MMAVRTMKMASTDERILRAYGRAIEPYYCHLCAACEGSCPHEVAVSVVNRSLMYAQGYGELALARQTYGEAHQARACASCDQCIAQCVRGLNIAEKMREAQRLFA